MSGVQGIWHLWLKVRLEPDFPASNPSPPSYELVSSFFVCFPHLQMGIVILTHWLVEKIQRVAICKVLGIVTAAR